MKANMRISPRSTILLTAACQSLGTSAYANPVPLDPPAETTIPKGPEGDAIKLGKLLLTDPRKQLPKNVGNALNCTNCHLNAGTVAYAGPFVGLWEMFNEYRSLSAHINSQQDRINDCFQRSMNGNPFISKVSGP